MRPLEYCLIVTSHAFVAAMLLTWMALRTKRRFHWLMTAGALAMLVGGVVSGYWIEPGRGFPELVIGALRRTDISAALVVAWGAAIAVGTVLPALLLARNSPVRSEPGRREWSVDAALFASVLVLGVTFVVCQAFLLTATGVLKREPPAFAIDSGFRVEKIADLDYAPTRVVAAEGRLFVCYDYFEEAGDLGGSVVELFPDQPQRNPRVVVDSPLLARCYGMAFRNGELYISRAGFWGRADRGIVDYAGTGMVTRFSDLDGDGYFEFAHDIVKDLPGVRGPETMHQNNGICFDNSGHLYITCASSANRALDLHPWGGTVLRVSPDLKEVEVFARGLRNPFGITVAPDGELFLTDNDVDENPGDKLLHLQRDAHYGHPYVLYHRDKPASREFAQPLYISEEEENLLGLAYSGIEGLPDPYRHGVFVAEFLQEHVLFFGLEASDSGYRVTTKKLVARIPSPIDAALAEDGSLYVISRNSRKVYRIRPKAETVPANR